MGQPPYIPSWHIPIANFWLVWGGISLGRDQVRSFWIFNLTGKGVAINLYTYRQTQCFDDLGAASTLHSLPGCQKVGGEGGKNRGGRMEGVWWSGVMKKLGCLGYEGLILVIGKIGSVPLQGRGDRLLLFVRGQDIASFQFSVSSGRALDFVRTFRGTFDSPD